LDKILKGAGAMKEAEIVTYILQHDARNLRLKRRLAERGIDWRNQCEITCRFQAPDQQHALRLREELSEHGFDSVVPELLPGRAGTWRVHGRLRRSIDQASSHEFTEQMVRSAAALSCRYDGWEASLPHAR
jgi:hypothetical protein